jgi:hypothetical protein
MTRKTRREIARLIAELRDDTPEDFVVTSEVVTVTDDMTDTDGNLAEEPEEPEGEILPTESDVVTVWAECMD